MATGGFPCKFLANECNWRLKRGGSGINKEIYNAAGPTLDRDTKQRYPDPAVIGEVYPVPLDPTSALREKEGVHYVLHCLGPNMNPTKSDCLFGDYEADIKLQLQQGNFPPFNCLRMFIICIPNNHSFISGNDHNARIR